MQHPLPLKPLLTPSKKYENWNDDHEIRIHHSLHSKLVVFGRHYALCFLYFISSCSSVPYPSFSLWWCHHAVDSHIPQWFTLTCKRLILINPPSWLWLLRLWRLFMVKICNSSFQHTEAATKWAPFRRRRFHYSDIILSAIAYQITGASSICSTVCSSADKRKHQSSASLASVRKIHW